MIPRANRTGHRLHNVLTIQARSWDELDIVLKEPKLVQHRLKELLDVLKLAPRPLYVLHLVD